jgi:DNA helicase-2/ATP-dependent DNA helicase PcrA
MAGVQGRTVVDAAEVLEGLDPEQRNAAVAARGPVCILAGAGTGKTRAITHRIAYAVRTDVVEPTAILAVTFTSRAAGELRTRLRALDVQGVQARTFHAAALRQLTYFAPQILDGPMPQVAENPMRWIIQATNRMRLRTDRAELRDLAGEIDWAKSTLISPDRYVSAAAAAGRGISLSAATVADAYAGYEDAKRRNNELDFADLLLVMAAAIESDDRVAARIRGQYRYFVIDEYQDVSPLQQRLLLAWLGTRDDICVVGDANQTIYSFAGARPEYLLGFADRFPDATVIRLHRDYRSTPQVVDLANRLMRDRSRGTADTAIRLVGQRPDGPAPRFAEYDDEVAEAAAAAADIKRLLSTGIPAAEIAVLFRVNAQSEVYEKALSDLGIPYLVRGGERFFERAEIRQAMVLLRGAARADDGELSLPEAVAEVLGAVGWSGRNPPEGGAARERWESLAALVSLAEQLVLEQPDARLEAFNTDLELRAASQHAPTVQGVTLASLHSAKGLEWDAVFLVGVSDQTIPIQRATTPEQLAEERRLFYVGITRARVHLSLSWALARNPGQPRRRKPSRFLDGLRSGGVTRRPDGGKRSGRTAAKPPPSADAVLFGRLRGWRKQQADSQGVPAYVVFSDATLVAIADAHPLDESTLAAVPGVGPTKLARYSAPVLEVVRGGDPGPVDIE